MDSQQLLREALEAPIKVQLEDHREAVEALRAKGYSWREVADFLNERGVSTDHTRLYRTFGPQKRDRRTESKSIDVRSVRFVGDKPTKRGRIWKVLAIDLPSKLGQSITVHGFLWGTTEGFDAEVDDELELRDTQLVTRTGDRGFPTATLKAELHTAGDQWTPVEIYVTPRWDLLF